MMEETDFISDLLRLVIDVAARGDGTFTEQMALQVEQEIRQRYGGDEVYIQRTLPTRKIKKQQAMKELARGRPVTEVSQKTGLSRSALYRLLSKN